MRILSLSLDRALLKENSAIQKRMLALSEKAGDIVALIPGEKDETQRLSPHLTVSAFGGTKLTQFFKMWTKAIQELGTKRYELVTVQDVYFLGFLGVQVGKRFSVPDEVQVHGFEKLNGGRAR